MTPTVKKIAITHPGVNNGLHAGSSCCVNLVYLGLLDSFFKTDTGPPVSDVLAPFIFPLSNPPLQQPKNTRKSYRAWGKNGENLGFISKISEDAKGREERKRKTRCAGDINGKR
jgi:hypothetical protein